MPSSINIDEAQSHLRDIIAGLTPDEEVLITEGPRTIARLIGQKRDVPELRTPGYARSLISIVAEDEDHLGDFRDYIS